MKMFDRWSTEELIQEVFLQDADPSEIITWLKKNVGNIYDTLSLESDPYYRLRGKYEIEWARSDNQKLKLAVCLYGKNTSALREIFFSEDAKFIKKAILKNHFFAANIGTREVAGSPSLKPSEVINLYEDYIKNNKNQMFFYIFSNISLDEDFLINIFSRIEPFDTIEINYLSMIIENLTYCGFRKEQFFSKTRVNGHTEDKFKELVNLIILFMSNKLSSSLDKTHKDSNEKINWLDLSCFRLILENTAELGTNGISDENILSSLSCSNVSKGVLEEHQLFQLGYIQRELARRFFYKYPLSSQKGIFEKFLLSDCIEIRGIAYQYAPLTFLYGINQLTLDNFFLRLKDFDFYDEEKKSIKLNQEQTLAMVWWRASLKKDQAYFVASLLLNKDHYRSKTSREFLRGLCDFCDLKYDLSIWPLGNGTTKNAFEEKLNEFKEKEVGFFKDEALGDPVFKQIESIKDDFYKKANDLNNHIKRQSLEINELKEGLDKIEKLTNQTLISTEKSLEINKNISDTVTKSISPRAAISSNIIFKIPILGRLIRLLIK